jgi:hypothetical protein
MSFPIQLSVIREVFRRTPRESLSRLAARPFPRRKLTHSGLRVAAKGEDNIPFSPRHGSAALFVLREARGADRDRTDDLRLAKPALSQLSYSPVLVGRRGTNPPPAAQRRELIRLGRGDRTLVGQGRVELPTSRLSGVRSNHLSYWPGGRVPLARPLGGLGPWKLNRTSSRPKPARCCGFLTLKAPLENEPLARGLDESSH